MTKINFVTCHRLPERSFFYKGKQFPFCARCTGIYLGYLTFPLFTFDYISLNLFITFAFIIPTFIDGYTQAFFNRESKNIIRLVTGILSGIGLMSLVSIIGKSIGFYILKFL